MKTHSLIAAAMMLAAAAQAQSGGVVVTSAPTLESGQSQMTSKLTDLSATLTQLLDEAKLQNEKLQTSLDRLGDPNSMNADSIAIIKQDVQKSATSLKSQEDQLAMMKSIDGSEVFNDTAFGVMTAIGDKITRKDGTEVDRDPEKYKMEAAMLAHVKEYRRVRGEAIARKEALTKELENVIDDMSSAEDMATLQKLQLMITALRGQIQECNDTIMIAQADAEMTAKELEGQARVLTKGKQEEDHANSPRVMNGAAGSGADTPTFDPAAFYRYWGRKPRENAGQSQGVEVAP